VEHYKVITALCLLVFTFVAKLVVGRGYEKINWIAALIELPVTLLALSISFLFVFTLTCKDETKNEVFMLCIPYLTVYILAIFFWRTIEKMMDKKNNSRVWVWGCLLCLNILFSFSGLAYSSSLLFTKDQACDLTIGKANENLDSIKTSSNVK
jgi:hypothetical protein